NAGIDRSPDELLSGIRNRGRAGVRDERDVVASLQAIDKRDELSSFIMLVQARRRRLDPITCQQMVCAACVFGRDHAHLAEYAQRSCGDVLEVANRGRDHEEGAGHAEAASRASLLYHWRIWITDPSST